MSTKVSFRHRSRLARLVAVLTMCIGGSVVANVIVNTHPVRPRAYIGETEKNVNVGSRS
jgi:hypothetical protein